jgi:hypothetical protein
MKTVLLITSVLLILIGIYITWEFFEVISKEYTYSGEGELKMDATGQTGDFIGGVVGTLFSLAGFVLLLLTFRQQIDAFKKERFENRFFELIKFHKENVQETTIIFKQRKIIDRKRKIVQRTFHQKQAFKFLLDQLEIILSEISPYFENKNEADVFTETYLNHLKNNPCLKDRIFESVEFGKTNLAYLVLFFGVSKEGENIIRKFCSEKYNNTLIDEIIELLKLKPAQESIFWDKWKILQRRKPYSIKKRTIQKIYETRQLLRSRPNSIIDPSIIRVFYVDNYTKYYGGNQFRLGHYFRHLFQTVKYVNEQSFLNYEEKYEYIKILRAQLSTYEQSIFFFNSLSFMGLAWELEPEYTKKWNKRDHNTAISNSQLITKYNLIKNLPGEHIASKIKFTNYYPDVEYELSQITSNKKNLLKLYS